MDDGFVLVIGSAGVDIKGRPAEELHLGVPNLGQVRNSVGGVARNIAENLARLEIPTVLLTAVGDDDEGMRVVKRCMDVGIDCGAVMRIPGGRTGTYLSFLKPSGELYGSIADFEIMQHVSALYLDDHADLFEEAAMIVIDATLSSEALTAIFTLAERYEVPVCADPTTPALASRLCEFIPRLHFISPNAAETKALCGLENAAQDRETAIAAARHLVGLGAAMAAVTLGAEGLAYADSSGSGFIRAIKTEVVDTTGAGDAFSAGVIFGLLNDVPVDEAMRLGSAAASLSLRSRETVAPDISQQHLYEHLH